LAKIKKKYLIGGKKRKRKQIERNNPTRKEEDGLKLRVEKVEKDKRDRGNKKKGERSKYLGRCMPVEGA